jgi:prepilin-type N-terminal cleavage/methylation domain-containing protein
MKRLVGFTLTELLVVMAIIAIMTMMTLPVVAPIYKNKALDTSVSKVQNVILKARSLAATTGKTYYVAFNTMDDSKNLMIIYSSCYYNGSTFTTINPLNWDSTWGTATGRKRMIADKPVFLDPQTKFDESNILPDYCGYDLYMIISPTGQVTIPSALIDETTGSTGSEQFKQPNHVDDGYYKIIITDGATTDPDTREMGIMKLTGELVKPN